MERHLRVGIIAPSFPPEVGGMQRFASSVASELAKHDEVTVFTRPGLGVESAEYAQCPLLTGDLRAISSQLSAEAVDVWLAMDAGLAPLGESLEAPLVCYFHGNDFLAPWFGVQRMWHKVLRRACAPVASEVIRRERMRCIRRVVRSGILIITNSVESARLISEIYSISLERVKIIPPGVDDGFFQPRTHRRRTRIQILTVARLVRGAERKNVDGLLRACRLAADKYPIHLTVVGDGDDRKRLEQLAATLGLQEQVTFSGVVGSDRLLALYRNADLFILAARRSSRDVEGFGIVYLEASAAGVPVICSKEGGATDAVEPDVNGMILDSSSPEAIFEGIASFCQDPDRFCAQRVCGFAERFRWPIIVQRLRSELVAHRDLALQSRQ